MKHFSMYPNLTPDERKLVDEFAKLFYRHWERNERTWLGVKIVKYPTDLFLYQMIIHKNRPDFIIETGAYRGGGASFFASMCDIVNHGRVISIDRREIVRPQHPCITYIIGRSTACDTMAMIREMVKGSTVMAVFDSDHHAGHVKRELAYYSPLITPGQYMVVEDTYLGTQIPYRHGLDCPATAVDWFLAHNNDFEVEHLEEQYLVGMSPGAWLRKK